MTGRNEVTERYPNAPPNRIVLAATRARNTGTPAFTSRSRTRHTMDAHASRSTGMA